MQNLGTFMQNLSSSSSALRNTLLIGYPSIMPQTTQTANPNHVVEKGHSMDFTNVVRSLWMEAVQDCSTWENLYL